MTGPHGWIQWKGTDVCMDVHCSCGKLSHIDADFCYVVKCGHCGKLWKVDEDVRFTELDKPLKNMPEPRVSAVSEYD